MGGFGESAHGTVRIHETGQKSEVARAFVLRALLWFDIEVNAVEPVRRVVSIKLHDRPNALQKLFPVFARFVGVFARK